MSHPISFLPSFLVTLLIAAGSVIAQPNFDDIRGQNAGDGTGADLAFGTIRPTSVFGGCGSFGQTVRVAGAPGWSGGRGRLEFWERDQSNSPPYNLTRVVEGTNPGDAFGSAFDLRAIFGSNSLVAIGAPGFNSGRGEVTLARVGCISSGSQRNRVLIEWTASGTAAGERMGEEVRLIGDLNGDGLSEVLAASPRYSITFLGRTDVGRVRVLDGATGGVLRTHTGSSDRGRFGSGLLSLPDLNGDGIGEYAIGEPGFDPLDRLGNRITDAGRLLVYDGAGGSILRQVDGTRQSGGFGEVLEMVGDVDADGVEDYASGMPSADLAGPIFSIPNLGRVEVRSGANDALLWSRNGGNSNNRFGASLSGGVDVTNDGRPDLLVGEPGFNLGAGRALLIDLRTDRNLFEHRGVTGEGAGAAVALGETGHLVGSPSFGAGSLSGAGRLRHFDNAWDRILPNRFAHIGASTAILDDVNGDGFDDLAVAQYDRASSFVAPIWEIVDGRNGRVLFPFTTGGFHGNTVGALGDVNGDGVRDFAQAEPFEGLVNIRSGSSPTTIIRTHNGTIGTQFGRELANAGDVDGDGTDDYLIGQPEWDNGSTQNVGRVSVFSGASGTLIRTHQGFGGGDQFGLVLGAVGDLNGDGTDDYGVGAPEADPFGQSNGGRAVVFDGASGNTLFSTSGLFFARTGAEIFGVGDQNADGFDDFVVVDESWRPTPLGNSVGRYRIIGGAAASPFPILETLDGATATGSSSAQFLRGATPVGDVDRDGKQDFAVTWVEDSFRSLLQVRAPLTADPIVQLSPIAGLNFFGGEFGSRLVGRVGSHADGRQELLVTTGPELTAGPGSPASSNGSLFLLELPMGESINLGGGCSGAIPQPPVLSATGLKVGELTTISVTGFPSSTLTSTVFLGPPIPPLVLGFGCVVHIDPNQLFPLLTFAPNGSVDFLIPDDPAIAGQTLRLQGLGLDVNGAFGAILTDAIDLRFGW